MIKVEFMDKSKKNLLEKKSNSANAKLSRSGFRKKKISYLKRLKKAKWNKPASIDADNKEKDSNIESQAANAKENWQQQYNDLYKKYTYLLAEYANYQKQTNKQIEILKKYDGQFFIEKLLNSVMDDFDKAMELELSDHSFQDFKKGIQMIYEKFKKSLNEVGIQELESYGQVFDPKVHSAIGTIESDKVPPDHIVNVLKKAYLFHDKLLRPALVMVAESSKQAKNE